MFLALLFVTTPAAAQTEPEVNATFAPNTVYDPPPASLELPSAWDLESVRAKSGNLARWRDTELQRLYEVRRRTGADRYALPEVGGYFAYFGDGDLPGGVAEARYRVGWQAVGEPTPVWARYTHERQLCGGRIDIAYADASEMTYLGAAWRDDFEALDRALGANSTAAQGRSLPAGVTLSFAQPPGMVSRYYPARAFRARVSGHAELACFVRSDLSLTCATLSENPIGYDFGEAAQRIMRGVRAREVASNGEPSAGYCVQRRIDFVFPN